MSASTKLILSSLVKTKNVYEIEDFTELDNFLVSNIIILPFSSTKKENAISLIKNLYSLRGISDPLLAISGRCYEPFELRANLDGSANPFNFFEITVEEKQPTVNANYVNLQINRTLFQLFYQTYLPKTSKIIAVDELLKNLFIDATISFISKPETYTYSVYTTRTLQNKSININDYYGFTIEPLYNFYSKNFEDAFKTVTDKINVMPDYYMLSSLLDKRVYVAEYINAINLNRNIIREKLGSKNYYDKFGEIFVRDQLEAYMQTINDYKKISIIDVNFTDERTIGTEDFPYSNTITFSNNVETNDYDKFLIQNNLQLLGINNFIANISSLTSTNIYSKLTTTSTQVNIEPNVQVDSLEYNKVFNFLTSSTDPATPFGETGFYSETKRYNFVPYQLFFNLYSLRNDASQIFTYIDLQTVFNNIYQQYIDYNKVYNLEELKNINTIGYIIEKKNANGVLLQTIGLLKDINSLDIKYIDTQVPYDVDITYEVYSIDLVPNISYIFESTEIFGENGITTVCRPSLTPKFVKNLLFTKTSKLNDNPPIAAIPTIITYQNIDNLVTLNLVTQVSEIVEKPINILQSDQEIFNKIYNNFSRTDGKILFKTNDPLKSVQLFVLPNNKPSSYIDFQNVNPIIVSMDNKYSNNINLRIQPNTKYYITCRSIDIHDLISNPSPVFELEMVSDNGIVYPIIKEVNFAIDKNYDVKKSFKKYLHIKPSTQYTQLITDERNNVDLGLDGELWPQKYKIRVTSKKSGKSFDINMRFKKSKQDLR
jgi:hypothetical protein